MQQVLLDYHEKLGFKRFNAWDKINSVNKINFQFFKVCCVSAYCASAQSLF